MSALATMARDLRAQAALCEQLLAALERESLLLREGGPSPTAEIQATRAKLLPALDQSLEDLRKHRAAWQRLSPPQRQGHFEINALIRTNQELIMKILLLDRQNERLLLRNGLLPPKALPAAQRERPHFVTDLYRRHAATAAGTSIDNSAD
jgi:hypothetical protein